MKKLFISLLAVLLLISLSGCASTKKTVCTKTYSNGDVEKITISSQKDKIVKVVDEDAYGGVDPTTADSLKAEKEELISPYNKIKGFNIRATLNKAKDTLTYTYTIDFTKLDFDTFKKEMEEFTHPVYNFAADRLDLAGYIKGFEDSEFTCK